MDKVDGLEPLEFVKDLRIHAWSRYPLDGINFMIVGTNEINQKKVIGKLVFFEPEDPHIHDQPTLTLSILNNAHQVLIDDLWKMGLRPSEEIGSIGQLAATEKHLRDMRELVWKLLPKSLRGS